MAVGFIWLVVFFTAIAVGYVDQLFNTVTAEDLTGEWHIDHLLLVKALSGHSDDFLCPPSKDRSEPADLPAVTPHPLSKPPIPDPEEEFWEKAQALEKMLAGAQKSYMENWTTYCRSAIPGKLVLRLGDKSQRLPPLIGTLELGGLSLAVKGKINEDQLLLYRISPPDVDDYDILEIETIGEATTGTLLFSADLPPSRKHWDWTLQGDVYHLEFMSWEEFQYLRWSCESYAFLPQDCISSRAIWMAVGSWQATKVSLPKEG